METCAAFRPGACVEAHRALLLPRGQWLALSTAAVWSHRPAEGRGAARATAPPFLALVTLAGRGKTEREKPEGENTSPQRLENVPVLALLSQLFHSWLRAEGQAQVHTWSSRRLHLSAEGAACTQAGASLNICCLPLFSAPLSPSYIHIPRFSGNPEVVFCLPAHKS